MIPHIEESFERNNTDQKMVRYFDLLPLLVKFGIKVLRGKKP